MLTVIPPDVNTGRYRFSVNEDGHIVYGIGAVKGVGEGPIDAIVSARDQDGPFRDLFDFCNRVDIKKLNKRVMEESDPLWRHGPAGPHRAADGDAGGGDACRRAACQGAGGGTG
ncbi:hypothetical protein ACLK2C_01025 [Escherichia coli]